MSPSSDVLITIKNMEQSIQVLYVDDDPSLLDLTTEFLEREDKRFDVKTATSPDEGLDQIGDRLPDCIISDYDMPDTDGIEFLQAIRETHPNLPFILYTGKGSEEVASDAISAGVTDYLQKRSGTDQYKLLANRITNAVCQLRTEQQLQGEKKRLQILLDRLPQAIVDFEYHDDNPIVRHVNSTFEDMFGYDADNIVGESLDKYIVPEDRTDEAANINRRVQFGAVVNSKKVIRRTTDGLRRFLLEKPVCDDGSGGFAIYTDITERYEEDFRSFDEDR
mgnify:CR=1 FL=1